MHINQKKLLIMVVAHFIVFGVAGWIYLDMKRISIGKKLSKIDDQNA